MKSEEPKPGKWFDNRTLVIVWLLVFFPVGLYGLWKGDTFDRTWKIGLTVAVCAVFLAMGLRFIHPAYVYLIFPAALVLLWKRKDDIGKRTVYKFAVGWCAVFLLFVLNNIAGPSGQSSYDQVGGSCAAVMTSGNCTYYRDDNCNVVAKQCSQ